MITIGIGEYAMTDHVDEEIITYALGSCVAFIIHCPVTKLTAMAHIVLPSREIAEGILSNKAAYYASDIVPQLLKHFLDRQVNYKAQLQIQIIGGAVTKNQNDSFKIGPKNIAYLEKVFASYGLPYNKKETLQSFSRTVKIDVKTGKTHIRKRKMII